MTVLESVAMQQVGNNQFIKASSGWPKVCYGVDLCSTEPIVVLAAKKHGRIVWDKVELNSTTLAKAVGDQAVTATCVSARDSLTRRLEAPFSSRKKTLRVLPTLLDIQLPFSIEDCQYEFLDYRKTDSGTMEALAVAATKDNISSKIVSIKEAGFDPEIIDIEGLAAWSQILHETASESSAADEQMRVVLILEGDLSSLTIGRGQSFLNSYGLRAYDTKRVLRLVKAYQAAQDEKVLWFLAGTGAEEIDLVSQWKNELSKHSYQDVDIVKDPSLFLARALAIRTLSAEPLRCNLRGGELTHSRIAEHSHGMQIKFALLLLVTGILLSAGNVFMQRDISARQTSVNKRVKASVDSLAGYHVTAMGAHALSVVKNSIAARKSDLKPFLQAFEPSLLKIIADIADVAKRNDLRLETISLNYDKVSVSGSSAEFEASEEIAAVLVRAGYTVSNKRGSAIADERIPFTITTEDQL